VAYRGGVDNGVTWVANIQKSQLGTPPPKSYVISFEETGPSAFLVTIDGMRANGEKWHEQFTRTYDGVEHAIHSDGKEHPGVPKEATETCTQVDPLTRHVVGKNNGKVTYKIDAKMAPYQKTMTTRQTFFAPMDKQEKFGFTRLSAVKNLDKFGSEGLNP
jgi:hypothetical protein